MVLFGMFQGMFFLPVILSLIGPAPYAATNFDAQQNSRNNNGKVADESQWTRTEGKTPEHQPEQEMTIVVEPG